MSCGCKLSVGSCESLALPQGLCIDAGHLCRFLHCWNIRPPVLTVQATPTLWALMVQTLMPMERDAEESDEDDRIGMSWGIFSDHISLKMAAAKVSTDRAD